MKRGQLKKRYLAFIAGVLSLAIVGAIWAYYHSESSIDNRLSTKKYGGEQMIEKFTPDEDWELGETVTKEVLLENTGEMALLVRVKLDERWEREGNSFITLNSTDDVGKLSNAHFVAGSGQVSAVDGTTNGDGSVVTKNLGSNKWVYSPIDGYWYYDEILQPAGQVGDKTELFLQSITLNRETDMGVLEETRYYTTMKDKPANDEITKEAATGWATFIGPVPKGATYSRSISNMKPGYEGYADANYSLVVTYETYQATPEAYAEVISAAGANWDAAKTPIVN